MIDLLSPWMNPLLHHIHRNAATVKFSVWVPDPFQLFLFLKRARRQYAQEADVLSPILVERLCPVNNEEADTGMSSLNTWSVQACHPVSAVRFHSCWIANQTAVLQLLIATRGQEVAPGCTSLVFVGHSRGGRG